MSKRFILDNSLDFLESRLPESEADRFQSTLESQSECRELYEGFLDVLEVEEEIAGRSCSLPAGFDERLMKELSDREISRECAPIRILTTGELIGGTLASLLSVFLLVFLYAHSGEQRMRVRSGERASPKFVSEPSYEVVDIPLENASAEAGLVRADHRVDVLWEFRGEGRVKTTKIIQAAQIFAVDRETDERKGIAQLLLTSAEARKAKLAVQTGRVSLSPSGMREESGGSFEPRPNVWAAPSGGEDVLFLRDIRSGQMVEYRLDARSKFWERQRAPG